MIRRPPNFPPFPYPPLFRSPAAPPFASAPTLAEVIPPIAITGSPAGASRASAANPRSEEHTSELQSLAYLVCRLLLEKKKKKRTPSHKVAMLLTDERYQ